jgi:hypothetical protein
MSLHIKSGEVTALVGKVPSPCGTHAHGARMLPVG